ncbi:unnamed protein product [Gadus morhua 'NCC']
MASQNASSVEQTEKVPADLLWYKNRPLAWSRQTSVEQTDRCQADSSGMEPELRGESGAPEPEAGEDYRQYLCRFLGKERADYFLGSSSDHLRPSTWDPTMTSANREPVSAVAFWEALREGSAVTEGNCRKKASPKNRGGGGQRPARSTRLTEGSPQPVPGGTRSFAGYSTRAPPLCQRATAKFQIGSLSFHPRARTYNRSLIGCTSGPWEGKAAEKAERKVPLTVHAEQRSERRAVVQLLKLSKQSDDHRGMEPSRPRSSSRVAGSQGQISRC